MFLRKDDHVLFFGDSITDTGRRGANNGTTNFNLGWGYSAVIAGTLSARRPDMNWRFTNRGIGGDRVYDLAKRLDTDVLELKPSVVSILIGVNDTWREFDNNIPSPMDEFGDCYRKMLATIVSRLSARLVILEPFLMNGSENIWRMRKNVLERIEVVRAVAQEFKALYIPLDGMFQAALCHQSVPYWTHDGVHPNPAGHALIANAWMDATIGK